MNDDRNDQNAAGDTEARQGQRDEAGEVLDKMHSTDPSRKNEIEESMDSVGAREVGGTPDQQRSALSPEAMNDDLPSAGPGSPRAEGALGIVKLAGKPELQTGPGRIQENLAQAEELLAASGHFFLRHGTLVMIHREPLTGRLALREATKHHIFAELDGAALWLKSSRGQWVPAHPPDRICTGLLQARTHLHLSAIAGVVRQPFFRPDGSLVVEPGHDAATGVYADFQPSAFRVPIKPTKTETDFALTALEEILEECAFVSPIDKSAALAAMLTAVVRASVNAAPLFHVRAHQAATGKSYLCRLITALATPSAAKAATFPSTDAECAKVLLAALKDGPEVLEFDNLTTDILPHDSLCSILTAEHFTGRILGYSAMKTVSTRSLFLSSGNNVGPVGDMSRRCITINLDAGCDLPAARSFANVSLLETVLEFRAKYVSAALTVIQAWIAAGRPACGAKSIASFGEWSALCRLPLIWLGRPDPAQAMFAAMKDDPQRTLIGRVLVLLHDQFGTAGVQAREILKRAGDHSTPGAADLLEVLQEVTESSVVNVRRLGHWLRRHEGHVVGGLRLTRSAVLRNVVVWRVEKV